MKLGRWYLALVSRFGILMYADDTTLCCNINKLTNDGINLTCIGVISTLKVQ